LQRGGGGQRQHGSQLHKFTTVVHRDILKI
jgi:hypothetical protein